MEGKTEGKWGREEWERKEEVEERGGQEGGKEGKEEEGGGGRGTKRREGGGSGRRHQGRTEFGDRSRVQSESCGTPLTWAVVARHRCDTSGVLALPW